MWPIMIIDDINMVFVLFQISQNGYVYHVGICDTLSQPGCEQSSLCRLSNDATGTVHKYTFNKMLLDSGHLMLFYDHTSPSSLCGK